MAIESKGIRASAIANVTYLSTARGFEPLRAEPNGFRVHHLSHSVTLSVNIGMRKPQTLSTTFNANSWPIHLGMEEQFGPIGDIPTFRNI